jgi:hypothetical protein
VSLRILPLLIALGLAPAAGWAQPATPAPAQPMTVEVDPIRCWWRTSTGAVRIGETFSVVLTCAVLEAEGVQVIPDESRLNDSVVQMTPFEVVSGSHPPDLRSGQRRFFQYDYRVRVINPDLIGEDVPLPNMVIHYRVNSRLSGNAELQGRDLTYLLPPHSMRVLSIVPAEAPDIRDMPDERFDRIEALTYRAGVLEIVALALIALGTLMAIVALVGIARRGRGPARAQERVLGERPVLALASRELAAVQRGAEQQGWSEPLIARALAGLRVAAACALARPVSQRSVDGSSESGDGRLLFKSPRWRGKTTAVFSAVTTEDVARELARLPPTAPSAQRQMLESLHAEMATLSSAQYGEKRELDREALDAALASAIALTRRLRVERIWPREHVRRWMGRIPQLERQT